MDLNRLIQNEREHILGIASKYGATKLRLFGSVARGQAGDKSDVDILVEFKPGSSLLDHVALIQDLEELLGRKVDVVNERALHWYIRDRVLKEARPL
jgi:predicted nucleotidyltransferase